MCKIIACVNEKGGVAKTTTIKNLSVGLSNKGKKVLAIDLDPSANLTKSLGITQADYEDIGTITEIFHLSMDFSDIDADFGIVHHPDGIDVIPSTHFLHNCESKLMSAIQKEQVLKRYVESKKDVYDYIFLDCPAGLGIFVLNALFCADSLIIPLEPHMLAVEAMQNLFRTISAVRKCNGTRLPDIMGILFTKVRPNTNNDSEIMEHLREQYQKNNLRLFNTFIPVSIKLPESDKEGQSIYAYAGKSQSAMIYMDLVDEFLAIESSK